MRTPPPWDPKAAEAKRKAEAAALPPTAPSPDSVNLTFIEESPREFWVQKAPTTGPSPQAIRSETSTVELDLAGHADGETVYVWDHKTGNLASDSVADVKQKSTWSVASTDFKDIAEVQVRVEHAGQPVAAADVTLDDGRRPQTQLLDPSTKGLVDFFGIKPGQLKITVKYKTNDGTAKSVTQLLDASATRTDPLPRAAISLAEDVATVAPTSSSTAAPAETTAQPGAPAPGTGSGATAPVAGAAAAKQETSNPIGSFVIGLISLGVVAGLIFVFFRYATQNKDLVQSKLQQLGVDIPKQGDDPQQYDPAPAPPKKAEPVQKIILGGDSAPDPIGMAPMATASSVATAIALTGEPRIVSDTGDAMPLPDGETIVGRDVGLGLSLVGESTVSRKHAKLVKNGNEVTVTDLGSTNGTYVNGVKISAPTRLQPRDAVQFGSVRFRYEA